MQNVSPVTHITGCAVSRDIYYVACSQDNRKAVDDAPYTVMYLYQHQRDEKWFYHELPDWDVVSTCFSDPAPGNMREVYALSEDGDVEAFSQAGSRIERIADAGLEYNGPMHGYVTRIRAINGRFYVCGLGGQVYRRGAQSWEHFDQGLS